MASRYFSKLFTASVKAAQEADGSRSAYGRLDEPTAAPDALTAREQMFISMRDSFYMATNNASGWPYLQHRGGPIGFVKVLDEHTLGLADFRGNRQLISVGNLAGDDRVSLFFMDYVRKARLKMLGRVRIVDLNLRHDLAEALVDRDYGAKVERGLLIHVDSYDWNCPQHITPRYAETEIEQLLRPLKTRIAELEARLGQGSEAPDDQAKTLSGGR
jgi:predicted pyridoxine 5'-phosphate oxidase superfamily flavin-nucleotide-binding protein